MRRGNWLNLEQVFGGKDLGQHFDVTVAGDCQTPGTARANATNTLTHVFDWATSITPTILSLAGVTPLEDRYAGKPLRPF